MCMDSSAIKIFFVHSRLLKILKIFWNISLWLIKIQTLLKITKISNVKERSQRLIREGVGLLVKATIISTVFQNKGSKGSVISSVDYEALWDKHWILFYINKNVVVTPEYKQLTVLFQSEQHCVICRLQYEFIVAAKETVCSPEAAHWLEFKVFDTCFSHVMYPV